MRKLLHNVFSTKKQWSFQRADLTETKKTLRNPQRGWYCIFSFWVEKKPDFEPMSWCEIERDTLALVVINIGFYREKELDEPALENIRSILQFFVKKQYDMILRITYDHEGKALEREPFFFPTVKNHLRQIAPIICEFSSNIFVYQGLMVGNWGEMHTSRFVDSVKLRELWDILKDGVGDAVFFAVRKPSFWRVLHPRKQRDSMGLFDDAIFGSEEHMGTFGTLPKEELEWEDSWCKQDELGFENSLCIQVPNGGEVICGEQYAKSQTAVSTVSTLKKMHITYLNRQYDEKILNLWKQWRWEEPGVWQGCSLYHYIENHLGYRFFIQDVVVVSKGKRDEHLSVSITLCNNGFANIYQDVELFLRGIHKNETIYSQRLEYNLRQLDSGRKQVIFVNIDRVECELFLYAKCTGSSKVIFFANQCARDGGVFLGKITETIIKRV